MQYNRTQPNPAETKLPNIMFSSFNLIILIHIFYFSLS